MERFVVEKITWDELEGKGFSSITDYCRHLVKNEKDLPQRIEIYRDLMLCMTVTDVTEAAKLDVLENKYSGPKFVKYKDTTMSEKTKATLALKRSNKDHGQAVQRFK